MFSYWAYILVGNDRSGKTGFQKHLVSNLCGQPYKRLRRNLLLDINNARMPLGVATLSVMSRSYQESKHVYGNVTTFFQKHFEEAHICILSSHTRNSAINDLRDMIRELRLRAYNVAVVFFSNSYDSYAEKISLLDWDERLWIENPPVDSEKQIQRQLHRLADEFTHLLIARASVS